MSTSFTYVSIFFTGSTVEDIVLIMRISSQRSYHFVSSQVEKVVSYVPVYHYL